MKSSFWNKIRREIGLSILLLLPIIIYYISHYYGPDGSMGTGFIHGDMMSYMSNARQHFDDGGFHLFYSNPFSIDSTSPHIYFQFQTLLLGLIWHFTNLDIGLIFIGFGIISALLSVWISLKLFKSFIGWQTCSEKLTYILFIYGGGILIISGFVFSYTNGLGFKNAILDCLIFDPGGGFWMLNFGRNFIYSTEAYYHFLSMGILYAVYKNRQSLNSLLIFILAFSHPFYGIQFLLLIISWQILDKYIFKNQNLNTRFIIINTITLLLFAFYYKIFMPSFASHQSLVEKWSINWDLKFVSALLAYLPIFLFFIYQIRRKSLFIEFFKDPFHRFLLLYFVGSFLLANHDIFIKPIQPIHFTHGNIYIPLFLLAAKGIVTVFKNQKSKYSILFAVIVFCILIFDNLSWFSAQYYINTHRKFTVAIKITPTQKQLIKYIDNNYNHEYLLLSEFITIDYFATSYTDAHALIPHNYNTPFIDNKVNLWNSFFKKKDFSILPNHNLLIVDNLVSNEPMTELENNKNFKMVYKNNDYILYERITN